MKQTLAILVIVVLVILGVVWFRHHRKNHVARGSAVVLQKPSAKGNGTGAASAAGVGTAGSGTTAGQPDLQQQQAPASGQGTQAPANAQQTEAGGQVGTGDEAVAPPATDSISRNPPNGMLFAGKGKYQLYRQGDITWRLDTDTGWACVLFATNAQWKLPQVYAHGCGTR